MEKNLTLNWEKYHFMVKHGIIPGHKVSRRGIEDDISENTPREGVNRCTS